MSTNKLPSFISFEEFKVLIKMKTEEKLEKDHAVHITHVIKNNSVELDGLIIVRRDSSISPSIYLNSYYHDYLAGNSIESIVEHIMIEYKRTMEDETMSKLNIPYEFAEMKSRIVFRLVNYDKNKYLLNTIPHIPFLDLAITFHCLVKHGTDGIGTIRINNEIKKHWNITLEELKKIAKENTIRLFPPVIQTMNEVVSHILNSNSNNCSMESEDYDFINMDACTEEGFITKDGCAPKEMYVLSNKKGINGASCLLYPNVLSSLAKKLNSDLYILPSSIHEIILIEKDNSFKKEDLIRMVGDVNQTQVPIEDVLSNKVYIYSREKDAISF